jgi:hypothetical protein
VKLVAWRFQGDYVRTQLSLAPYGFTQNNFRFSTGIVLRSSRGDTGAPALAVQQFPPLRLK